MKSCRDITKLIASERKRSFFGRMSVVMHLMMCKACRLFKLQCNSIDDAIRTSEPAETLDDEAREKIQKQICEE